MRFFVRWNQAGVHWLDGRLGPAERGLAEVLAELRAADEAVRRLGGEPTQVFRAVEGGTEFFAGFLATRVCYDLGQVQRAQGTWMPRWPPTGKRWRGRAKAANHPIWAWRTWAWPRSCTSGTS